MSDIEKLLIDDILNDIPDSCEHGFSEKYLKKRRTIIKKYSAKETNTVLRMRFKLVAVLCACFVLLTGWNGLHFVNGFAVSRTQIFVQLTPELTACAPSSIEAHPDCAALEGWHRATTALRDDILSYEFSNGKAKLKLRQYTVDAYNDYNSHRLFHESVSRIEPFSNDELSGLFVYNERNGYSLIITASDGYILELGSSDMGFTELADILSEITLH